MAIITRWRMPPDSSCGIGVEHRAPGAGSRPAGTARASRAAPRRPAFRAASPELRRPAVPTRMTGFSAVIGSWKIIARSRPRRRRHAADPPATRSSPSSRMRPAVRRTARGNSPMMLSASMLLPQPDSPTTPSASPGSMLSRTSDRMFAPEASADVQPLDLEQRAMLRPSCADRARHAGRRRAG